MNPFKVMKTENVVYLQHVAEYKLIMSAATGGSNEKRLAGQFMARFFKYFPSLSEEGVDVIMELCADQDVNVSVHFIL